MTKNDFNMILNETPSLQNRSKRPATVLGMYLTKLRTGEPDERLATKFNISRITLECDFKKARECLAEEFMPQHLGLNHISRDEVVARNLLIPSHFFSGNDHQAAILVCGGTYVPSKKCQSCSKENPIVCINIATFTPFLIVCTDGYIVDVLGPYKATTSDATIMSELMREESPLHDFLLPDDAS